MKIGVFFDLVRHHEEVEGEAKRIGDLENVVWAELPTRWLVMALEHFAVMLYVSNQQHPEQTPTFWIDMKQRVYKVLMRRLMPMREAEDAGRYEAA